MGSSGGGSSTQRVIQDLPDWSKPYWEGIARSGKALAREPYREFPGRRIALFNPMEREAFSGVQSIYDQGARPELAQVRGIATQASNVGFNTPTFPGMADRYMNPYLENVLDLGRSRMMRDYQQALGEGRRKTSDAAIRSGVIGGRSSLAGARESAAIADEAFRAMREFEADTRFKAFDQAQQAFQSDVAARQAQQAGVRGREMEQAIRDQAYQDFLDRRDYKRNQLNYFAALLSGTPYASAMNQTTRTGGGGPGLGQTIAGLGIAGIGAAGKYFES
jgi:hypothetical protein